MAADPKYPANYLDSVIVRVDLAELVLPLLREVPAPVLSAVAGNFPLREPQRLIEAEVQVSKQTQKVAGGDVQQRVNWLFHGSKRDKTITLAPEALFIVYKKYASFASLRDDFLTVLHAFFQQFDTQAMRFGLRYINRIRLDDGDPLDWQDFLAEHLLQSLRVVRSTENLAKLTHEAIFNHDEVFLKCQFGIYNPDYPARIYKRQFTLDFDAFSQGPLDGPDIEHALNASHDLIQGEFEASITEALRIRMRG